MQRLTHLKNVRAHFGSSAALLRIGDRVIQAMGFEVHKLVRQDNRQYKKAFAPIPQCTLRSLTPEDVELLASDPENRLPGSFANRVRSGKHLCLATFWNSQLAAYGWYALGSIDAEQNAGVPMSYPADTACAYRLFTHPAHRGQMMHAAIRPHLVTALAELGVTTIVGLVSWTNWPSRRHCERVGYQDLGHLVTIGPRRHRWWFAPRKAAAFGIRFGYPAAAEDHRAATTFCSDGA